MRLFLKMLAMSIVVALLANPATDARSRKVKTQIVSSSVKAQVSGDTITGVTGMITAAKSKCVPGRAVDITSGPSQSLQSPFGSGVTDSQGVFDVSGSAPRGSFFAIHVNKARVGNARCKPAAHFGQLPE